MQKYEIFMVLFVLLSMFLAGLCIFLSANKNLVDRIIKKLIKPAPDPDFCNKFDEEFKEWVAENVFTDGRTAYMVTRKDKKVLTAIDGCFMLHRNFEDADKQRYRLSGSADNYVVRKIVFDYKWI